MNGLKTVCPRINEGYKVKNWVIWVLEIVGGDTATREPEFGVVLDNEEGGQEAVKQEPRELPVPQGLSSAIGSFFHSFEVSPVM